MNNPDPRLQGLRAAYDAGNLVVFAGAGVSAAAGLPTWRALAERLLGRLRAERKPLDAVAEVEDLLRKGQLVDALSAVKLALGSQEFHLAIEEALDDRRLPVPEIARAIAALRPKLRAVLTTNLDRLLERAFEGEWDALARATGDIASRRGYILKLHGTLLDRSTWVFSREQYDRALFASPAMRGALTALIHTCPVLFVGCGLADDDLDQTFAAVRALSGDQPPMHFALVAAGVPPYRRRKLEDAGLRLVEYDNADGKHGGATAILRGLQQTSIAPPPPPPISVPPAPSSAPQPRARGAILLPATILEVHQATITAGLVASREALLSGIDPAFVASLSHAPSLASQILGDLHALNRVERLLDASVPLAIWLSNAERLAGGRVETVIFQRALAEVHRRLGSGR